ncbi:MAG: alpha/beta fold hydrolase [Dehalococcoidia bacterium]|nr:alpha/beta fold hydrolase [Dehalococcoidia bacterium]
MPLMDLGDVSIHYEERGQGDTTFVFCHGLGGSGRPFEEQDMDWYAERFRTISWDNRGLGRSSGADRYSLPLYASDLDRLLDRLGVERAVLHGVSWGGVVVQRFAIDYPERCAAIVLDSTSSEVNVRASENWYLRGEVARLGSAAVEGRETPPAFEGHATVTDVGARTDVAPEHLESYVAECRATAGLREHPMTPDLKRISCPALVIGGGKDTVAGAGGSVVISRHVPDARLEIVAESGHGVYREAREEYHALLLDFLQGRGLL